MKDNKTFSLKDIFYEEIQKMGIDPSKKLSTKDRLTINLRICGRLLAGDLKKKQS